MDAKYCCNGCDEIKDEIMGWKLAVLGKRGVESGIDGLVKGWEIIDRQELGSVNCWILFLS